MNKKAYIGLGVIALVVVALFLVKDSSIAGSWFYTPESLRGAEQNASTKQIPPDLKVLKIDTQRVRSEMKNTVKFNNSSASSALKFRAEIKVNETSYKIFDTNAANVANGYTFNVPFVALCPSSQSGVGYISFFVDIDNKVAELNENNNGSLNAFNCATGVQTF